MANAKDRRRQGKFSKENLTSSLAGQARPGQVAEKGSGAGEAQAMTQLLFVLSWAASQSKQSRVGK